MAPPVADAAKRVLAAVEPVGPNRARGRCTRRRGADLRLGLYRVAHEYLGIDYQPIVRDAVARRAGARMWRSFGRPGKACRATEKVPISTPVSASPGEARCYDIVELLFDGTASESVNVGA